MVGRKITATCWFLPLTAPRTLRHVNTFRQQNKSNSIAILTVYFFLHPISLQLSNLPMSSKVESWLPAIEPSSKGAHTEAQTHSNARRNARRRVKIVANKEKAVTGGDSRFSKFHLGISIKDMILTMPSVTKQAPGSRGLLGHSKKERRTLHEQLKASSMSRAEKKTAMDKINRESRDAQLKELPEEARRAMEDANKQYAEAAAQRTVERGQAEIPAEASHAISGGPSEFWESDSDEGNEPAEDSGDEEVEGPNTERPHELPKVKSEC